MLSLFTYTFELEWWDVREKSLGLTLGEEPLARVSLSGVIPVWMFPLQMMQSLKALLENADAVYEKIVHCQKAGK